MFLFLCLEPTIFQYHSSFWTESFYFSIQLLILTLVLNENGRKINYILIGILLGLLFLQRSAGIFYFLLILLYFFYYSEKDRITKITLIALFYFIICITLGIHNYKRAGVFYIMPTEGKYSMYRYFAKDILIDSKNFSLEETNNYEVKRMLSWIEKKLPEIDSLEDLNKNSPYELASSLKNEKDRIKAYSYINKRSYEILLDNPLITIKKILKGYIHFTILNPFFVYYDLEYYKFKPSTEIGDFVYSEQHKKVIPLRILYSLVIHLICFVGVINLFKKNSKICIFITYISFILLCNFRMVWKNKIVCAYFNLQLNILWIWFKLFILSF